MTRALAGLAVVLVSVAAGAAPKSHGGVVDFYVANDGCVVLEGGNVACWGPGFKRDVPAPVAGITKAVGLAFMYSMIVIRDDGSAQNIGEKPVAGKVARADGVSAIDTDGRALQGRPGAYDAIAGVSKAVDLCDGENHRCFVQRDGKLVCLGSNGYGQLGTKPAKAQDNPDLPSAESKPSKVPGIADAVGVACGSEHTCALHRGGTVECWGSGYQGNLGDARDQDAGIRRVKVPGLSGATAIVASDSGWTTCALRKTGAIHCWGFTYDWMPRDAQEKGFDLPALDKVMKLRMTNDHVCALTEAGEVHCLGTIATAGPLVDGRPPTVTAKTWRKVYP